MVITPPDLTLDNDTHGVYDAQMDIERPYRTFVQYKDQTGRKLHQVFLEPFDAAESVEPAVAGSCLECSQPFRIERGDYTVGWGERERLEIVTPQVPMVRCGCSLLIDDITRRMVDVNVRTIRIAIELSTDRSLELLRTFLPVNDVMRIRDFVTTRWPVRDRAPTASAAAPPAER